MIWNQFKQLPTIDLKNSTDFKLLFNQIKLYELLQQIKKRK